MTQNNDFEALVIDGVEHDIKHLKDLNLVIDVAFENGDARPIKVHMRPTNHLFSREKMAADEHNKSTLITTGYWLKSYVHHVGNYQHVKGPPHILKEIRVFCHQKWADSFLFPSFVTLLSQKPEQITILANAGNDKTCLSGILEIDGREGEVYLVFFSFTKVSSKEVNMLIESAYCVDGETHSKAKRLINPSKGKEDVRPFITVLKNVMEGRKPLEGVKKSKRQHKMKKGAPKCKKPCRNRALAK